MLNTVASSGFVVRRGTNLSHWLSQSRRRGAERRAFFTAADVRRLADWGFDHLRLPVDEEQLWTPDGRCEEDDQRDGREGGQDSPGVLGMSREPRPKSRFGANPADQCR